ncbi:hypothetical protein MHYP_G00063880 [Metynnis hypsauchen]
MKRHFAFLHIQLSDRHSDDTGPLQTARIWGILQAKMSYVCLLVEFAAPQRSFPFSHTHFLTCQPGNVLAVAGASKTQTPLPARQM